MRSLAERSPSVGWQGFCMEVTAVHRPDGGVPFHLPKCVARAAEEARFLWAGVTGQLSLMCPERPAFCADWRTEAGLGLAIGAPRCDAGWWVFAGGRIPRYGVLQAPKRSHRIAVPCASRVQVVVSIARNVCCPLTRLFNGACYYVRAATGQRSELSGAAQWKCWLSLTQNKQVHSQGVLWLG